jgi:hypothetical protein
MADFSLRSSFWGYYGSKFKHARRYPRPEYDTIVEPFAGSAGYSMHYPHLCVILVEKYPVVAEVWRYLIRTPSAEILRIPSPVWHIDELPGWVPEGARYLVGFCLGDASALPRKRASTWARQKYYYSRHEKGYGWTNQRKLRIAAQVNRVRHWKIIEGDYSQAPDIEATWFVDPPYNNRAGTQYVHSEVDYDVLAAFARSRRGQVIVCENEGADWLPFRPYFKGTSNTNKGSFEAIWTNDEGF